MYRHRVGNEPGGASSLAWGHEVLWWRPHFNPAPYHTICSYRLLHVPCSSHMPYSQHWARRTFSPTRATLKDSLCSMHWEWCHPETRPHSHPLWNLHHTSLQTLPCSLEDRKENISTEILTLNFWSTFSAQTKSHYYVHNKPEFTVPLLLALKRKNFKALYSSPFTHSEREILLLLMFIYVISSHSLFVLRF